MIARSSRAFGATHRVTPFMSRPRDSMPPLAAANAVLHHRRMVTAVTDGPVRNAPRAAITPSSASARIASRRKRTTVSKRLAAASGGRMFDGTPSR